MELRTERRVCVSTRNPHKLAELAALLAPLDLGVVSAAELQVPEVEETGATFADNALLKAAAAFRVTGLASLADDSGLMVDALDGEPGVYSARFAGPDASDADNNRLLLERLADVPEQRRGAAFHCALALLVPEVVANAAGPGGAAGPGVPEGARLFALEGSVAGRILEVPRGAGGFGYDPLFLHPPTGLTFAELDGARKNRISHRARAFAALHDTLAALWPGEPATR
ncbi:MAG: non-canonical purine NTP pyrophosphatase [Deltaproteobacteria bacterium]|nr:non-canonical purine NTP pyrophosphatase [Deltaproteobacteria bacterium]